MVCVYSTSTIPLFKQPVNKINTKFLNEKEQCANTITRQTSNKAAYGLSPHFLDLELYKGAIAKM